ncbi:MULTISPECIES: ParB/RepB/Spo0J family partition protein [unclassified Breznakia]|uniref:ParB/RepB/Spo0J family partition protein n=1 Tax=unclassified Breznakia TaxID=2623764 RepID=UPI002472EA95|nr:MULTISPECIES: ParB/RepB/Spo0J family partition protein [unclassified Breznakia]MDH6367865.1 ParB family chromosome partitioning protein [Breznakia sp. PH1-1]MDH6404953.1 ParB family chromosome partitioning protein [Breznakia sp. PF1-11]MDH6412668.1 ParB family chromosome partitioning protein [Breznakia sp. PFB1-11]MDH6415029.1 ParB family chromosome partitioning protein [Breznakia sp. PFB1-14]MDH6417339.1 ParB family chromosome partitioning protein [Breznakia sp. PFB1-4]
MANKSVLSGFVKQSEKQIKKNESGIEMIHYHEIGEAIKNRGLRNIEELAEDIREDGLEQNLVVRIVNNDLFIYELIAGHRRYNAMLLLIEQGHKEFEYMPCKVVELDNVEARRRNLLNNMQVDPLSPTEMMEAIQELKEYYELKKASGEKIPGRIRKLIANDLGLGSSTIGNYENIMKNAIPEVKEKLDEGSITLTTANEMSSLDDDEQLMFVENDTMDLKTIKDYKEEKKNVPVAGTNDDESNTFSEDEFDIDEDSISYDEDYEDDEDYIDNDHACEDVNVLSRKFSVMETAVNEFKSIFEKTEVSHEDKYRLLRLKNKLEDLLDLCM